MNLEYVKVSLYVLIQNNFPMVFNFFEIHLLHALWNSHWCWSELSHLALALTWSQSFKVLVLFRSWYTLVLVSV